MSFYHTADYRSGWLPAEVPAGGYVVHGLIEGEVMNMGLLTEEIVLI